MSGIATQGQTILRDSVAHRELDKYYQLSNILQKQYIADLAEYIPHASNNATDVAAYHIVENISYLELRLTQNKEVEFNDLNVNLCSFYK